jgi:hypothetical protein
MLSAVIKTSPSPGARPVGKGRTTSMLIATALAHEKAYPDNSHLCHRARFILNNFDAAQSMPQS